MLRLSIQIKFFCNAHKQDNETKNKKKKKKEKKKKQEKEKKKQVSRGLYDNVFPVGHKSGSQPQTSWPNLSGAHS